MRKNGGKATQEVVDMINSVRQRSFKAEDWEKAKYTTATLTMDEFLAEKVESLLSKESAVQTWFVLTSS